MVAVSLSLVLPQATVLATERTSGQAQQAGAIHFMQRSRTTAHVRIVAAEAARDFNVDEARRSGYVQWRVRALVVEGLAGPLARAAPGTPVSFDVTLELPGAPPSDGEVVVSLNRRSGRWMFADTSALWVPATPALLDVLRSHASRQAPASKPAAP